MMQWGGSSGLLWGTPTSEVIIGSLKLRNIFGEVACNVAFPSPLPEQQQLTAFGHIVIMQFGKMAAHSLPLVTNADIWCSNNWSR